MTARWRCLPWWTGALAGAGVLVTHAVAYRLVVPDHHHRAEVLHSTGHAHWPVLPAVLVALLTAASVRAHLRRRGQPSAESFTDDLLRLLALQACIWLAVEAGERAASGSLATLDDQPVLVVGLLVQCAVALAGACLAWLGRRTVAALANGGRRRGAVPRPRSQKMPADAAVIRRPPLLDGPHGLRGPPSTLLAS